MRALLRLLPASAFLFAFPSQAKTKIRLDTSREMHITYTSPAWNTDPTKIDSAFLIFRDSLTNRMVQIQLEETEPDSSTFVGEFSITWADANSISPEIYIPSQDLRTKGQKAIFQVISSGKLARKPLIVKRAESGGKIIAVFDTREEAENAWKAYQEELKLAERKLIKPVPSEENVATAEMAKHNKEMKELAEQAVGRESNRARMEQEEREKIKAAKAKFAKLSPDEQQKRKEAAKKLWTEAMASYNASDFVTAEKKFREAIDKDPTENSYYFNFGVSQYRNEKMDAAMVSMRIAPDEPKTSLEKKYYMGLIHLKLKELDPALKLFDEVGAAKDPVLSPSALYYKGVLYYSDGKFEEAKQPFEDVIDTSQDPKLDEQAEQYLDRIANAIAFRKMAEQKWNLTGTLGLMYDSNVLLAPDNQVTQGAVQNKGDIRLMSIGTVEYRPIFTETREFSGKFTANMTNSSNASLSTADAWIYTLEAPYSLKTTMWGKGYKFTARPGYEMLYMALSAATAKRDLLNSPYIAFDNTFVMHDNWYSTYTFQYRRDNSLLNLGDPGYGTDDDASTANQYYLKTSQMFLLNNSKQEALILTGGLLHNVADGANKTYDRFEVGTMYARPIGSFAWNAGINYYILNFPTATPQNHRQDENYSLSTGVSKPVNDWFTWGVTAAYTDNASTQTSTYQYQKFIVMTTATFNTGF